MTTTPSELPVAEGGTAILTESVPTRVRWDEAELTNLTSMIGQSSLLYWNGPQTKALLEAFRKHYPLKYCAPCSSGTDSAIGAMVSARKSMTWPGSSRGRPDLASL